MKKKLFRHMIPMVASAMALLTSCSEQYNITGNSLVDNFEGNTMYIKVRTVKDGVTVYDSTYIQHGKFDFEGMMDSTTMAAFSIGDDFMMPFVLDNSPISVTFSDAERNVKGGLNDALYKFLRKDAELYSEINNLSLNMARFLFFDDIPNIENTESGKKIAKLEEERHNLWADFIIHNDDNVLGREYFVEYTNQYYYPVMTKYIERIVKHAPKSFYEDPRISHYLQSADINMRMFSNRGVEALSKSIARCTNQNDDGQSVAKLKKMKKKSSKKSKE